MATTRQPQQDAPAQVHNSFPPGGGSLNEQASLRQELAAGFATIRDLFNAEQQKTAALERGLGTIEKAFSRLESEMKLMRSDMDRVLKAVEDEKALQRIAMLEKEREDTSRAIDGLNVKLEAVQRVCREELNALRLVHAEEIKTLKGADKEIADKVEGSQWKMVTSVLAAIGAIAMALFQWYLSKH